MNINPERNLNEIIEWNSIEGFSEIQIYRTKILIIKVNNPEYWIENEKNKLRKKMMEFNNREYNSPFNLSANSMQINHNELLKILNENFEKHKYAT